MFKYIILTLFLATMGFGEDLVKIKELNSDVFGAATRNGIVVVEFWAGWNCSNKVTLLDSTKFEKATIYRIDIEKYPDIQIGSQVVVVPTLIFYDEGEEIARIQGDLTFTLNVTKKQIQKQIDAIVLSKFK